MKPACKIPGCGFTTWNEVALGEHEAEEHVECTCGRVVARVNYSRHAGHHEGCSVAKQ
jgi:hypothetical protein